MSERTYFYSAYGLTIQSEIPLPPLTEIAPMPTDVRICRGKVPEVPELESTKIQRAGIQAQFAQYGTQRAWLVWEPLMLFMAQNGNELIVEVFYDDEDMVSLFTLSEAVGLLLFQRGSFLLHGSAIQLNGQGIVFIGEPGAGKSTTVAAFAKKGVDIVSDDMVCIRFDEAGQAMLLPAFPQVKIWDSAVEGLLIEREGLTNVREGSDKFSWHDTLSFASEPVQLQKIYVLTNAADTPDETLALSQVPIELLQYFPLPEGLLHGEPLREYFNQSVRLAQQIPVVRMSRPASFSQLFDFVDSVILHSDAD